MTDHAFDDDRMDVIGTNGNDGLHYGEWIEWNGGPRPVPPHAVVIARHREDAGIDKRVPIESTWLRWDHRGDGGDIVAYRVVSEAKADIFEGLTAAPDMVNHPPHYTAHPSGVECIQITEHMGFCLGNAMKYIWRADLKNGVEDLRKARWYIEREIAKREAAND